ncbi:hypothetical protein [Candidatus Tisiphia endosymbiont of Nemotelus uliginosus]|uniref:hypothetical protein n=1 Tax=Candidatus Tisiphia endosymbiont of Nemotelus uliginosus TaxID=3077926 RepID=UPI0035C8BCF8
MSKGRHFEDIRTIKDPKSFNHLLHFIEEIIPLPKNMLQDIESRGAKALSKDIIPWFIETCEFLEKGANLAADSMLNEEEKEKLTYFATKVSKISKIASNIEHASEEYIPKIWTIFSHGIKGLLSPLAGIISPIVDLLKNVGNSFIEGIQSIFSQPLEKQGETCLQVADNAMKMLEQVDRAIDNPNKGLDYATATLAKKGISNVDTAQATTSRSNNTAALVDTMKNLCTTTPLSEHKITPPSTPGHKPGPSSSIQR